MNSSVTFELSGDIRIPGFKPRLWMLASKNHLGGWVTDGEKQTSVMRLDGADDNIKEFIRALPAALYPHFRLRELHVVKREDVETPSRAFKILGTAKSPAVIQPDYAPCPDCMAEMMDPKSRRYCYPFWSCSKCGPSYSSMLRSPFIRKNTYLSSFPPCKECEKEQHDEHDKRHYHSELLSCPKCGPRLFLTDAEGTLIDDTNPITHAQECLQKGEIVALQSLFGGFFLFFDPFNRDTIERLRKVKKMPDRPIAVMARNVESVRKYCACSEAEERLLCSKAAPTVIMKIKDSPAPGLPFDLLAPDSNCLGVSLPPTTLIALLFEHLSANQQSFEMLATCSTNWDGINEGNSIDELFQDLVGVADHFLCHDLRIGMECSSSVAVIREGAPQIWRRSRGYTPLPVNIKMPLRRIAAAFGGDNASSVALGTASKIMPSQMLGKLHSEEASQRLVSVLEHYCMLFDTAPDVVACDMNMDLYSSQAALSFSEKYRVPLIQVQTHHAHALACMAEAGLDSALAFVFDNGSPGPDGIYWGAELLEAGIGNFRRLATFAPANIPGGINAVQRPARQFIGRLLGAGVDPSPVWLERLKVAEAETELWRRTCEQNRQCIATHAAARLLDCVAAGLGLAPDFTSYDGQNAMLLGTAAMKCTEPAEELPQDLIRRFGYQLKEEDGTGYIDWSPTFQSFADPGWIKTEDRPRLALAFYQALANAIVSMAEYGASKSDCRSVVLSGTTFMNELISDLTAKQLRKHGFIVHLHRTVPLDESGIAVGQAYHAGLSN